MPKPVNPTIANCPCSVKGCDEVADVRREKAHERGALYLVCPEHGKVSVNGASYKAKMGAWIEQNMYADAPAQPEPDPVPVPEPEPTPAPAQPEPDPVPVPEPAPEKPAKNPEGAGFLKSLMQADKEFSEW